MSVKFEDEASKSLRKDTKELAHKFGERLTGGKSEAGYLAVCLPNLPCSGVSGSDGADRVADLGIGPRCSSISGNCSRTRCAPRC